MIRSKEDYQFYIEADRIAKAIPKKFTLRQTFLNILFPDYIWRFQLTLRKLEYYKNCKRGVIASLCQLVIFRRFKKLSLKLGFSIPPNVFGPGLSIAHYGTIIINSNSKIGANCRLHACVNIGTKAGFEDKVPIIGDNCYIAPGVKMYGDIQIGDNIAIGANSVVFKSVEESDIAIAGAPVRKISNKGAYQLVIPGSDIVKRGLDKQVDKILQKGGGGITAKIHLLLSQNQTTG